MPGADTDSLADTATEVDKEVGIEKETDTATGDGTVVAVIELVFDGDKVDR